VGELVQAVATGPGADRVSFLTTAEGSALPAQVFVFSVSGGVFGQSSLATFGPPQFVVNNVGTRIWANDNLDITAPAGTDHIVVDLAGVPLGGGLPASSVRFDGLSLKMKL
jgi:hypothetical protein